MGANDDAVLVDPYPARDVGDAEQGVHPVGLIDQGRVLGLGVLDEGTKDFSATHLEADGNELDALVVYLTAQRLPPGQVHAAASVGCPGHEDHFLAPQRRQPELVTVEVGQDQLRCLSSGQGSASERLGADGRQPEVGVVDDGHAEPFGGARHIEVAPG